MKLKWNEACIDGPQMLFLLVLSRVFSVMVYSPGNEAVPGTVTLAVQLPALALTLGLMLPWFWAAKKWGRSDLPRAVDEVCPLLGKLCAALCLLFCLLNAARTLTVQTDFLIGTIYRAAQPAPLLLALWAAALYTVRLGPEAFARLGLGVFVFLGAVLVCLALQLLPQIDLLKLSLPRGELPSLAVRGTLLGISRSSETAAALLLLPQVRRDGVRWAKRAACLWSALTAAVAFLTQTVLGNFAALRAFPVFSLASAAEEGRVPGRMDGPLLALWIFLALLRCSLYLWQGAGFLSLLWSKGPLLCLGGCGLSALAAALLSPLFPHLWQEPCLWGGLLAAVALGVPSAALYALKKGGSAP